MVYFPLNILETEQKPEKNDKVFSELPSINNHEPHVQYPSRLYRCTVVSLRRSAAAGTSASASRAATAAASR